MFDFGWSEIALIGIVALVLIGPKDLPIAIRAVTDVIKKMRRMAGELQGHVDEMLREADLKEAHDAFRDLRGGSLRDKMFRAIDNDGTLRRTMTEKPLAGNDILGLKAGLGRPPEARTIVPADAAGAAGTATTLPAGPAPAFLPPHARAPAHPPVAAGDGVPHAPPPFIPPGASATASGAAGTGDASQPAVGTPVETG